MSADGPGTEELLRLASQADRSALARLLGRHRRPLRQMVAARLEKRLAARVDPSDIVQEALADVGVRLPGFLRDRPMPYWAWLRRLALQRLIWWRRFHLGARKRSAFRDRASDGSVSERSTVRLVDRLAATGTSPSGQAVRDEERASARQALAGLAPDDRQVLELRYVEDLSFAEIAAKLELSLSAVKMRHLRALERMRGLLGNHAAESKQ
jgi:RNA polymerase sigma-70 factor (ECF subfamily)